MHVTLISAGARGDIQPYIALGQALQRSGHRARLVIPGKYTELAAEYGLEAHPIRANFEELMQTVAGNRLTQSGTNFIEAVRALREMIAPVLGDVAEDILTGVTDTDVIVCQSVVTLFGQTAAELNQCPLIVASPGPVVPTRDHPSIFVHIPDLGGWINRLTVRAVERVMWWVFGHDVNEARKAHDLPAHTASSYSEAMAQAPALGAFSEAIYPRPSDLPEHYTITGYWFLDHSHYRPDPLLADFLAVGDAPVYIGFGSMAGYDARETAELVVEALRLSGQRGILATGWGGLTNVQMAEDLHVIQDAPHGWLFPQLGAVVHHGGAGTTAAGLRAGVPSIIVPHTADQPFWGQLIERAGVGPMPIPRRSLTAERLADAIRTAIYDMPMRERARQLGERIQAEDGTGVAIRVVEETLASHHARREEPSA